MHLKSHLIFLFFFFLLLIHGQTIYYINENTPSNSPDGTENNPYTSLAEAIQEVGAGQFEFILLGDNITLNTDLSIPSGSNYTIRPESTEPNTHFPFFVGSEGTINAEDVDLQLQNLQIIELNGPRNSNNVVISLNDSHIVLDRILITDIHYPEDMFILLFVKGDTTSSEVTVLNSEFNDLTNVAISVSGTKITVEGCGFSGLIQTFGAFFTTYSNFGRGQEFMLRNSTLQNTTLGLMSPESPTSGFVSLLSSTINVTFDNFIVRDISMINFWSVMCLISDFEDQNSPTSVILTNIQIENFYEKDELISANEELTNVGLVFDITGATNLYMANFTAKNAQLRYSSLVKFLPNGDYFLYLRTLLPSATLRNISIQDSNNVNFVISTLNQVDLQNVQLQNNTFNFETLQFALFFFNYADKVLVQNVYANTQGGPILKITHVLNQQIYNCTFENITTSQKLETVNQNLIQTARFADDIQSGLNPNEDLITVIRNFNIDGFTDVEGINYTRESNDSYAIYLTSDMGEAYIQNSQWSNIEMGSLLSISVYSLQIDNLIVNANPLTPNEEIAWHRVFQFVNLGQVHLTNSLFMNNQNAILFNFYNIRRGRLYDQVALPSVTFDNITVVNNTAKDQDTDSNFVSLFILNSPQKPVKASITNSLFQNNTAVSGIILTQESYRVDLDLTRNRFENNYALQSGTVLNAQSMQDTLSTLRVFNNVFANNTCLSQGGVFSFVATNHNITAINNTYRNNYAGNSGGVGYGYRTGPFYREINGNYFNNSANNTGGAWYFWLTRAPYSVGSVTFQNTRFANSAAIQQGGALYVTIGNLTLQNCSFRTTEAPLISRNTQFVTLESSSSLISNSSFIMNTTSNVGNNGVNGGAISIKGTGGTHQIVGSLFEENQGLNGGAIFVSGMIANFLVENSNFERNIATVNGGAIYFDSESVTGFPAIIASSFEGNQATQGGAIYINNQNIIVQDSNFQYNDATEGRSIAFFAEADKIFTAEGNIFIY